MPWVKVYYSCPKCNQKDVPFMMRGVLPRDTLEHWQGLVIRKAFERHGLVNLFCLANVLDIDIPEEYRALYRGRSHPNTFMENE